ncbi:hypothetical protein [Streptomyces sp. NPDC059063]|uniref:hypothetical protein n=1 Tax=Streptomyces sp. NPDC059063 TaxID=3346712 RepID=UPI00367B1AB0
MRSCSCCRVHRQRRRWIAVHVPLLPVRVRMWLHGPRRNSGDEDRDPITVSGAGTADNPWRAPDL